MLQAGIALIYIFDKRTFMTVMMMVMMSNVSQTPPFDEPHPQVGSLPRSSAPAPPSPPSSYPTAAPPPPTVMIYSFFLHVGRLLPGDDVGRLTDSALDEPLFLCAVHRSLHTATVCKCVHHNMYVCFASPPAIVSSHRSSRARLVFFWPRRTQFAFVCVCVCLC
jgi:hypothetical protein